MAKSRRKRHQYTEEQRSTILSAARKDGLTALQVQKKFGVTPVTYYSWRKKTGAVTKRGRGPAKLSVSGTTSHTTGDLTSQVRSEVRAKIQAILPAIVKTEVASYVDSLFGSNMTRKV